MPPSGQDEDPALPPHLHMPVAVVAHYRIGDGDPQLVPGFESLVDDIARNGIHRPLEIATDSRRAALVDGNTRLIAAERLRLGDVPVRVLRDPPDGLLEDYDAAPEEHLRRWLRDSL